MPQRDPSGLHQQYVLTRVTDTLLDRACTTSQSVCLTPEGLVACDAGLQPPAPWSQVSLVAIAVVHLVVLPEASRRAHGAATPVVQAVTVNAGAGFTASGARGAPLVVATDGAHLGIAACRSSSSTPGSVTYMSCHRVDMRALMWEHWHVLKVLVGAVSWCEVLQLYHPQTATAAGISSPATALLVCLCCLYQGRVAMARPAQLQDVMPPWHYGACSAGFRCQERPNFSPASVAGTFRGIPSSLQS